MDLIQYFSENHAQLLYLIAGVSFVVELAVIGLGGPLLFFAIACFITGVFTSLGILGSWESEIFAVGVLTGVTALLLWQPLRNFQNRGVGRDTSSDMIGQRVPCSAPINSNNTGTIRHSGINWNARLSHNSKVDSIAEGATCVITAVEGNVMIVASVSDE